MLMLDRNTGGWGLHRAGPRVDDRTGSGQVTRPGSRIYMLCRRRGHRMAAYKPGRHRQHPAKRATARVIRRRSAASPLARPQPPPALLLPPRRPSGLPARRRVLRRAAPLLLADTPSAGRSGCRGLSTAILMCDAEEPSLLPPCAWCAAALWLPAPLPLPLVRCRLLLLL